MTAGRRPFSSLFSGRASYSRRSVVGSNSDAWPMSSARRTLPADPISCSSRRACHESGDPLDKAGRCLAVCNKLVPANIRVRVVVHIVGPKDVILRVQTCCIGCYANSDRDISDIFGLRVGDMSGSQRLPGGAPRKASQRKARRVSPGTARISPRWRAGD